MARAKTWRGFTLKTALVFDPLSGELLDKTTIFKKLERDILALQDLAQWQIDSYGLELLKTIDDYDQKPNAAGLYMGLKLPDEVCKNLFSGKSGVSRFEKIWRGEIVTALRSWKARADVVNETSARYVNAGFKRTARDTKPQIAAKMNLGYADPQYVEWVTKNTLSLVVDGDRYHFLFDLPKKYALDTVSTPTIRATKTGLQFDFAVSADYQQCELSERYVVGVDVGIAQPATAAVWDTVEKQIVESTALSQRVAGLRNSITASQDQIKFLYKKYDRLLAQSKYLDCAPVWEEICFHRSANISKKRELAIIVGQEVAELAFKYNAVVAVEDLSWIKNTMSSGRWNRGEVVKWIRHFVEQNGSRVVSVNAAYTTKECHNCLFKVVFEKRCVVCKSCGMEADRDVNAAANIAQRGVKSIVKMVASRKKSKYYEAKKPKRVSPQARASLKRPGLSRKKVGPTARRISKKYSSCRAVIEKTVDNVRRDERNMAAQDSNKAASIYQFSAKLQPLLRT